MRIQTVESAENSMLASLYIARLGNTGKTQVAHEICRARINSIGRLRSCRWLRENEVKSKGCQVKSTAYTLSKGWAEARRKINRLSDSIDSAAALGGFAPSFSSSFLLILVVWLLPSSSTSYFSFSATSRVCLRQTRVPVISQCYIPSLTSRHSRQSSRR